MPDYSLKFRLYAVLAGRDAAENWEKVKVELARERVLCDTESVTSLEVLNFWLANIIRQRMWIPPPLKLTWVDENTCEVTDERDGRPLYTVEKLTPGPIEAFFFHC
jgi:hypothetical protein